MGRVVRGIPAVFFRFLVFMKFILRRGCGTRVKHHPSLSSCCSYRQITSSVSLLLPLLYISSLSSFGTHSGHSQPLHYIFFSFAGLWLTCASADLLRFSAEEEHRSDLIYTLEEETPFLLSGHFITSFFLLFFLLLSPSVSTRIVVVVGGVGSLFPSPLSSFIPSYYWASFPTQQQFLFHIYI